MATSFVIVIGDPWNIAALVVFAGLTVAATLKNCRACRRPARRLVVR